MKSTVPAVTPLNVLERNDLRKHEATIEAGQRTFFAVGNALIAIRDKKLFRETHKSFDKYCQEKWDFGKAYAYRLIAATEVVKKVSPIGDTFLQEGGGDSAPVITTETQARALGDVPPEDREAVLEAAIEATDGKLTARAIREAASAIADQMSPIGDKPANEAQAREPEPCVAILKAMNTETIKPTPQQVTTLAAMDEDDQEAILEAVVAGRQTLRQAMTDGPLEPGPEEIGHARAIEIDRLCRALTKLVADHFTESADDPWLAEKRALIEGDLRALKNTLCSCKAVHLCPQCQGTGCQTCKRIGRVTKYVLDKAG